MPTTRFSASKTKKSKLRPRFLPPQGCGCKSNIAATLQEMGVGLMLAGNMGDGAKKKLADHGIEVIRGCSGPVEKVVKDFLQGTLSDSGVACLHHECH
ncbi:NifB/NifX family molybdenum-iron cluster-binding protein [Porphyromonas endodontalis]|uniref:NifB/NifX family molybdenum-iron cluster-binding protein n=1 Tax=Porphyromonas endodontalis TaxID=28124 RepID=UPI0028EAE824|nr:NifB/NifX family molybdenum-iron cluster-binding protein [Porphyromonas endodontalis]